MKERILEISKNEGLSHIGSNLGMAEVLAYIYEYEKQPDDLVILDAGHAHLAHLVAKEKYEQRDFKLPLHDIHCNYDDGCDVGTGSLGLGLGISVGLAIANKNRNVIVLTTDGAVMEGIVWEAFRIKKELGLDNLKIHVNCNGYGAYKEIDTEELEKRLHAFCPDITVHRTNTDFGNVTGLDAHYKQITDENYKETIRKLKAG